MNGKEKQLIKLCVKHLERALAVKSELVKGRRFDQGKVIISEEAHFEMLAALDLMENVKNILKDRT